MKGEFYNDTLAAAGVLLIAAAGAVVLVILSNRGDMTSAALVLAGTACFLVGIFLLSFYKGEPVDPHLASLLAVQGTVGIATLCADLGVRGDALFIPESGEQAGVVQIIPVSSYSRAEAGDDYSFIMGEGGGAVRITPTGYPLLSWLQKSHELHLPSDPESLATAVGEVCTETLELADKVEVERGKDTIALTLYGYRLVPGCDAIRNASPKCCTMVGCPVCSLIACMIATGLDEACTIAYTAVDGKRRSLHLIISILPAESLE